MKIPRSTQVVPQIALTLAVAAMLVVAGSGSTLALCQTGQSGSSAGNTSTSRTNNPDGSTTVTTTTAYKDGSTTTETTYDKDGHDAGTVRTDVQTKDGETTTTITRYDGNGHEIGKTVTRVDKDGNSTVTNYDGNGRQTDSYTLPPFKYKPDWKIGLDYKVPPEWRYLPKLNTENQNSANSTPPKAGTTRVSNADGTTITTVSIFSDGWIITVTRYDKDGHDAGTTRTDVQSKDGLTTTTTTKWDGNGHETGKTIERSEAGGSKTIITYDGNGNETGRKTIPKSQASNGSSTFDQLPEDLKKSLKLALDKRAERMKTFQEASPVSTSLKTTPTSVTLVLPAQATGTISGMVMTEKDHPERFKDIPGIQLLELGRPLVATGSDGNPFLDSLMVDTGNHVWQAANRPILCPNMGESQTITVAPRDNPASGIATEHHVNIHRARVGFTADDQNRVSTPPPRIGLVQFSASPVSLPGVAAVHGPLSGNIAQMVVAIGNQAVFPFAANQNVAFYTIPPDLPAGPTQVTFLDGARVATRMTIVLKMGTGVDQPVLHKGGETRGHVRLETGSLNAKQKQWVGSNFRITNGVDPDGMTWVGKIDPLKVENTFDPDLIDLNKLQKSFPNFSPQARAADFVFLGIQNLSPTISIDGGPIQFFSLPIQDLPLEKTLKIKAKADGPFDIQVVAQLFSAPRACQELQFPPTTVKEEMEKQGYHYNPQTGQWEPPPVKVEHSDFKTDGPGECFACPDNAPCQGSQCHPIADCTGDGCRNNTPCQSKQCDDGKNCPGGDCDALTPCQGLQCHVAKDCQDADCSSPASQGKPATLVAKNTCVECLPEYPGASVVYLDLDGSVAVKYPDGTVVHPQDAGYKAGSTGSSNRPVQDPPQNVSSDQNGETPKNPTHTSPKDPNACDGQCKKPVFIETGSSYPKAFSVSCIPCATCPATCHCQLWARNRLSGPDAAFEKLADQGVVVREKNELGGHREDDYKCMCQK